MKKHVYTLPTQKYIPYQIFVDIQKKTCLVNKMFMNLIIITSGILHI